MFCNRCGTQLQPDSVVCPKCGRQVGEVVNVSLPSRLDRHVNTLSVLWMVIGGLFLIPATGLILFGSGMRFVVHDRQPMAGLFPVLMYLAASTLAILAAGGICVGLGLQQRQPWARMTAIVLGVLALFHPPLGTALGAYTLWVLLGDESGEEYRQLQRES